MNPSRTSHSPLTQTLDVWQEQNRLEQEAIARRDWETLERCQAEKEALMLHLDRLLQGRSWDSSFASESARQSVRDRVDQIDRVTRSTQEKLRSLVELMQGEQEECRRSLRQVQKVRGTYGHSLGDSSGIPGTTWVGRS